MDAKDDGRKCGGGRKGVFDEIRGLESEKRSLGKEKVTWKATKKRLFQTKKDGSPGQRE